jgi:hypothetical protein
MAQQFAPTVALLLCASMAAWASSAPGASTFDAEHRRAVAANPGGVHFKISLDSGQATYRIGETIRLKYELTAVPGQYVAGARFLDNAQRSVLETFVTDRPADAQDPLHDYWEIHKAMDGNLSAPREPNLKLDATPQFDTVELSHYLRFAKPGRYRLYVVTRSVIPRGAPVTDQGGPPIASENFLTFEILPQDLAAASREVEEIVARAHQQPLPRFTPVEAFRLFEMGTAQARKTAAGLYTRRNSFGWSDEVALATVIAAPRHREAIQLLRFRLHDTSLVADENLITELSLLQFLEKNPQITPALVGTAERAAIAAWRAEFAACVALNWQVVAASVHERRADIRASTLHSLDHMTTYHVGSGLLPIPTADRERIRSQHLAAMPDLPYQELANDLLNFGWSKTLPSDQVLAVLIAIYAAPPAQNASFVRDVALREIAKLDQQKAQSLFREHVLDLDSPLDWSRLHSMNLPSSPDLDAELIRILEDRWTERMSRIAPILGLYATDSILPRVKKVYEVYGAAWPCSIQSGLLTYFLRVDSRYGIEKLAPALSAYYDSSGSDCHQGSLLVDLAVLRNSPELQPLVVSALSDARPEVAAAAARVMAFGDQAKIPLRPLLARLRALHDEWPDFESRSSSDPEYMNKWNSGYNELERILSADFANSGDTAENSVYCKQALDLCITDFCRSNLRQRIMRRKF